MYQTSHVQKNSWLWCLAVGWLAGWLVVLVGCLVEIARTRTHDAHTVGSFAM